MNKKVAKIIIIIFALMTLTGCTKILKNSEGKPIENPITGQKLASNIVCQPEDKTTLSIYEENNIDISSLPKCDEFTISSGGYEGIWTSLFIKPLSWLIIKIANFVKNYGISIILITLLIRLVMLPITKKTALQSENLKKAKPELEKLEKKYSDKSDKDGMMRKSQEMLLIYKKYGISPMSGCIFSLIQIPLFFAFYESLSRIPAIYESKFLIFQLGTSPKVAIMNGSWYYAITIILIFIVTFYSFKLNATATMGSDQEKQMKMFTNVFLVVIVITSITMPTCIGVYWIVNNGFTIIQNLLVKRGKRNDKGLQV